MEIEEIDSLTTANFVVETETETVLAGETDKKTNRVGTLTLSSQNMMSPKEIDPNRISYNAPETVPQDIEFFEKKLREMPLEELKAIDENLGEILEKKETFEPNFIIKVQNLIASILAQFNEISKRERDERSAQKIKYTQSNQEWGSLQKETGDRGMVFTGVATVLMCAQFVFPQADREIISFLADKGCTNLANMFNSNTQSKQRLVEGISQLAMAEINAGMNKSTPSNEQFTQVLKETVDVQRGAARELR